MAYAVLNGDLISSRRFGATRAARLLDQTLRAANRRFAPALAAPFMPFQGDAFQGVFADIPAALDALLWIEARLEAKGPLGARYGLGLGRVEGLKEAPHPSPALLAGNAFIRAEAALKEAKRARLRVVLKGDDPGRDAPFNAAFRLGSYLFDRWPPGLWKRLYLYLETGDLARVAAQEGVSYQAIHKQFKSRGVRDLLHAFRSLRVGLEARG